MKPKSHLPIIQKLVDEHTVIQNALVVLRVITQRVTRKRPTGTSDLRALIHFFREYADKIHHGCEEEILFERLQRSRSLSGMIQKLGSQHTMGRIFLGEMSEAVAGAQEGRRGWRQRFEESAAAYHTLLSIHICDENHLFFPRAERALRRMRISQLPDRPIATAAKRRFERSIHRLVTTYAATGDAASRCDIEAGTADNFR